MIPPFSPIRGVAICLYLRVALEYSLAVVTHKEMNTDLRRAISQLRDGDPMESSTLGDVASYVDLSFEGRTLQLRCDQVTVANIARTFRLIPETIILVSDSAIPDENGCFPDIDSILGWTVEGDKSSRNQAAAMFSGQPSVKSLPPTKERWKPHSFPRAGFLATSKEVSVAN